MSSIDGTPLVSESGFLLPPVGAPPRPLASAGADPSRDPDEIGTQFETLFLTYLVKELKLGKTPGLDGEEDSGVPGAQVYEGFITNALAESLSKSGAFGIGKAVAEYVREHARPDDDAAEPEGTPKQP